MLIRNLDFLSIPKEFSKVNLPIYESFSLTLVAIEKKGYALVLKEEESIVSLFLLKTELFPNELTQANNESDKNDFINIISMMLEKVYHGVNIKEYDKQHPEHVFLRFMDDFIENNGVEIITEENSKLYSDIEKGFMKLDIDVIDSKLNSLNKSINEVANNFSGYVENQEENEFGNKIKKMLNSDEQ